MINFLHFFPVCSSIVGAAFKKFDASIDRLIFFFEGQ